MPTTLQLLDTPPTFFTFADDGVLTLVESFPGGRTYEVWFDRQGREWGPFTVGPGDFSQNVPRGQGRRFEDVQAISLRLRGGSGTIEQTSELTGG